MPPLRLSSTDRRKRHELVDRIAERRERLAHGANLSANGHGRTTRRRARPRDALIHLADRPSQVLSCDVRRQCDHRLTIHPIGPELLAARRCLAGGEAADPAIERPAGGSRIESLNRVRRRAVFSGRGGGAALHNCEDLPGGQERVSPLPGTLECT